MMESPGSSIASIWLYALVPVVPGPRFTISRRPPGALHIRIPSRLAGANHMGVAGARPFAVGRW